MFLRKVTVFAAAVATLASCGSLDPVYLLEGRIIKNDVTNDYAPAMEHGVADMIGGVWVDGNRCEHWIIDDGVEGYMSPRWNSQGLPACSDENIPYTTLGFNRSAWGSGSINNY